VILELKVVRLLALAISGQVAKDGERLGRAGLKTPPPPEWVLRVADL